MNHDFILDDFRFRTTCAYYMEKHMDADKTQDLLRCPMCMQWFHEACFEQ